MARVAAFVVAITMTGGSVTQPPPARVPVVVELFTSEGCSSCPPADALLSKLGAEQPLAGVQIIPLGMHVTYWDQLGWKDPASLKSATDRQQQYGARWGGDRVYTPQAVIDGREELVGSDTAGVRRAIEAAARTPHATLAFAAAFDGDQVLATLAVTSPPAQVKESLAVRVFVTEDGLSSVVKRGENGGRTLHHDAVVRVERLWDAAPGADPARLTLRLPASARDWNRARLNAVAVLYGTKSGHIFGAATTPLR